MADPILERIHELPVAASWNGFFPQDKPGGTTECVSVATVEAKLVEDGFVKTAMLVAGYQPLENQRLRTTDSPTFAGLLLSGATANKLARFNASKNLVAYDLVAADIPALDTAKITTGTFADARIASAATWNAKLTTVTADATSRPANTFYAAPNGAAGTATFRAIVAADIPTLNQNTTGSAAKWTTPRTLTIGATGKTIDGTENRSWTLAEIGAQPAGSYLTPSNVSGTAGQVAVFTGTNTVGSTDQVAWSGTTFLIGSGATAGRALGVYGGTGTTAVIHLGVGTVNRFSHQLYVDETYRWVARDATGATIDVPLSMPLAAGSALTLRRTLNSQAVNIGSGYSLQISGTDAITSARAGDLTALKVGSTTGFVRSTAGSYSASALSAGDIPATINSNTTGSAAKWTTPRTLTIGATGKAVDGSTNVSWTLAEIGALAVGGTAANSSGLGAVPADYFVQGNGTGTLGHRTTKISAATATPTQSGFYDAQSPADGPQGAVWTHMIRNMHSGGAANNQWMFDIAAAFGGSTPTEGVEGYYVRTIWAGSTPGWRQLWHSGNLTPAAIGAAPSHAVAANTILKSNGAGGFAASTATDDGTTLATTGRLGWGGGAWRDLTSNASYTAAYASGVTPSGTNYGVVLKKDGTEGWLNGTTFSNLAVSSAPIVTAYSDRVNITNKLQIAGVDRITNAGGFVGTSLQISGATANKLARFDASKNLVSYDLVAADIPALSYLSKTTPVYDQHIWSASSSSSLSYYDCRNHIVSGTSPILYPNHMVAGSEYVFLLRPGTQFSFTHTAGTAIIVWNGALVTQVLSITKTVVRAYCDGVYWYLE